MSSVEERVKKIVAEQLGVRRPWRKPDEHRRIGDPPRVVAAPGIAPFPLPAAAV